MSKKPTKEELTKVLENSKGDNDLAASSLGISTRTVERYKKIYGLSNKGVGKTAPDIKTAIYHRLLNGIVHIETCAKELKIADMDVYKVIHELEIEGKIIEKSSSGYYINQNSIAENKIYNYFGKKLRFGAIGDTHCGSKEQQITHLNTFYDICEKEGIQDIYHTGDVVAGDNVYRGQRFETFCQSLDDQAQYVIEQYPLKKKIKTHFITGNHDFSFYKTSGADIGAMIANQREDMVYLGRLGAYINLSEKIKMHLLHPDGGGSYAKSYRPQKIIENYASENKPNIVLLGHFHTSMQFYTRNVHAFTTGAFEGQTNFLLRKGLYPEVGGWIIDIVPAADGSVLRIKGEWIPFYKNIFHDY